jgi:c-di-GMP-binding flagellar brake protein YcgR
MLTVGDKIDVRDIRKPAEGERRKTYISQIVEIENSTQLKISMPIEGTKIVPLPEKAIYECVFYTPKGLFSGEFVVQKRFREGNFPMLRLQIRRPLKKVQRREFYRFDCTLPMKYRIASEDEKIVREEFNSLVWKDGIILDLSGGGMRFVVQEDHIEKDAFMQFHLVLEVKGEYKPVYVYGEVISSKVKPNNIRLRECRVQFVRMSEPDQNLVVAYIFEEERKKLNVNT